MRSHTRAPHDARILHSLRQRLHRKRLLARFPRHRRVIIKKRAQRRPPPIPLEMRLSWIYYYNVAAAGRNPHFGPGNVRNAIGTLPSKTGRFEFEKNGTLRDRERNKSQRFASNIFIR